MSTDDNQGKQMETQPLPESAAALQVVRILVCIALTTCSILVVSDICGFFCKPGWFAKRNESVVHRQSFWLRIMLFANAVFSVITLSVLTAAIFIVPFDLDPSACDVFMEVAL